MRRAAQDDALHLPAAEVGVAGVDRQEHAEGALAAP
eukprot:CAMPEP_0114167852 /NCGR_PEP_ID=MMETSP0043_2-20121206/32654_1 /TAXON_ID=464988 /ORGANISM="Hemiselmis andersenii, Strain CCMP644" /LENGTH=35 /DNA_ID= /DNA_START= /DNA_END= /DNA_ORIENTATION=